MAGADERAPAIADYGFLSDCASSALVSNQCSVDWWCVPRFDSPSVFGRLLDPAGGHWRLTPRDADSWERDYVDDSLVLRTVARTSSGAVRAGPADRFRHGRAARQLPAGLLPRRAGQRRLATGEAAGEQPFEDMQ